MYTQPQPKYRPTSSEVSIGHLRCLGYDIHPTDDGMKALIGIIVAMAEQIEYLKDELERIKSE